MQASNTAVQPDSGSSASRRRHDIDALRVLAIGLVLLGHSAKVFDTDRWIIKNAQITPVMSAFFAFLVIWLMQLMFLLAGATTFLSLRSRSNGFYVRERLVRLFVPFLAGCALVIPPQVYIERITPWVTMESRCLAGPFHGSFFEFYPQFFTSCYPKGNFTWNHLWFIIYLLLYSVALLPLMSHFARKDGAARRLGRWLANGRRVFLVAPVLMVFEWLLRARFPNSHALYNDWANHVQFSICFALGALIIVEDALSQSLQRNRGLALSAGVLASALVLCGQQHLLPGAESYAAQTLLSALACWGWVVAAVGYGATYLNTDRRWLSYGNKVSYSFYIFHQTIIVVLGYFLVRWEAAIALKFIVLCFGTVAVTLLVCELCSLSRITCYLFGLPQARSTQRPLIETASPVVAAARH